MFKFKDGRIGTGYKVLTIFASENFKKDLHIIKFPVGSYIPSHTDSCPRIYTHHRINLIYNPGKGGEFKADDQDMVFFDRSLGPFRFVYFCASGTKHSVAKVEEKTRWVLSTGWFKLKKEII